MACNDDLVEFAGNGDVGFLAHLSICEIDRNGGREKYIGGMHFWA